MLEIRSVLPSDFAKWKSFMVEYFAFYKFDAPEAHYVKVFAQIQDSNTKLFSVFAILDGELAGVMNYVFRPDTFYVDVCYICDIYVDPFIRKSGVATTFFNYAQSMAKASGIEEVYWMTNLDNPARKLYDRIATQGPWVVYSMLNDK